MPLTSRTLTASCLLALTLFALAIATGPADAAPQRGKPRICSTDTQSISDMKRVRCKKAKRVVSQAALNLPDGFPTCEGDAKTEWSGWKIKPMRLPYISTKFKKGRKSFVLSGGGTCR